MPAQITTRLDLVEDVGLDIQFGEEIVDVEIEDGADKTVVSVARGAEEWTITVADGQIKTVEPEISGQPPRWIIPALQEIPHVEVALQR